MVDSPLLCFLSAAPTGNPPCSVQELVHYLICICISSVTQVIHLSSSGKPSQLPAWQFTKPMKLSSQQPHATCSPSFHGTIRRLTETTRWDKATLPHALKHAVYRYEPPEFAIRDIQGRARARICEDTYLQHARIVVGGELAALVCRLSAYGAVVSRNRQYMCRSWPPGLDVSMKPGPWRGDQRQRNITTKPHRPTLSKAPYSRTRCAAIQARAIKEDLAPFDPPESRLRLHEVAESIARTTAVVQGGKACLL